MNSYFETSLGKIYHGNAKDVLQELEPDSIDLVITDPPYPKKYLPCFEYLAEYAPALMKHGASLFTVLGHYELEKVMQIFLGKLKYRWIIDLDQFNGKHPRMLMGIEVMWKPMLWYVKGSYPSGRGFVKDAVEITSKDGQDKKLHKWQQSEEWCDLYIRHNTRESDLVLDPYFGSGTVGESCEKLGRRWIGIDIDEKSCEIAAERLSHIKLF